MTDYRFGVGPDSHQGVVIASYSGRHSRMWTWDIHTLKILGYQDIKARVELLDVSPDGRYAAYYAESHAGSEHYIAICRPPYFKALWIQSVFHLHWHRFWFGPGQWVAEYQDTEAMPWHKVFNHKVDGCPSSIVSRKLVQDEWEAVRTRCINPPSDKMFCQVYGSELGLGILTDPLGRHVQVVGSKLLVEDNEVVDMARTPFEAIYPPDWAGKW